MRIERMKFTYIESNKKMKEKKNKKERKIRSGTDRKLDKQKVKKYTA